MVTVLVGVMLAVLHAMDHRAGAEEEQRLEEGVRDQVEYSGDVGAYAQSGEHVAKLRDRREGQHPFDVGLRHGDDCRKQRRKRPDHGDEVQRSSRAREHQRIHANNQVHTGGDHGRGMDQGADGGGTFHGVRQPYVQRELRRLADRAPEDQDRGQRGHRAEDWHRHLCKPPAPRA